ncbi:hypothetical protein AX16_002760 [Volvariella volvacea WC 439]|nr:hypothetical protein AX16_002760 [Volvariella volvacea WC 439]
MLGVLLILFLARTLAYPVDVPPNNPIQPAFPVLNSIVDAAGCIRDPRRVRSLPELLYNCFGTIAICTYIAIHPNMPDRRDSFSKKVKQKLQTTICALLAPEAVIVWAMKQNILASKIADHYKVYGWTKTHGFFVLMGGLIYDDGKRYRVVTIDGNGTGNVYLGGEPEEWMKDIRMPIVSEEEILDKAKGDLLSKLLAVLQTSWFVLQCITRHAQGLVITELELVTLAFATLNVITYFLWWNKPLNASYPIYFKSDGQRSNGPLSMATQGSNSWQSEGYRGWWIGSLWDWIFPESEKSVWRRVKEDIKQSLLMTIWKRLIKNPFVVIFRPLWDMTGCFEVNATSVSPYFSGRIPFKDIIVVAYGAATIGVVFGGLHLIGWNFDFPTEKEKLVWRISSVVVAAFPALYTPTLNLLHSVDQNNLSVFGDILHRFACYLTFFIAPIAYALARIALLVLPLFALRNLPPSAYENVLWSEYIPHI